jgi:carbonic anhydrase
MMRKVIHFDSPREWYKSGAAVVGCFDSRFETVSRKLLKRLGVTFPDLIRIAGGAKTLASPEQESHREFILDQIQKSIRLHGTERAILLLHSDCGAYGGLSGGFQGDPQAETSHYRAELERARRFLNDAIPGLTVECFIVDFEAVWACEGSSITTA